MFPYIINIYIHMYAGRWGFISSGRTAARALQSKLAKYLTILPSKQIGNDLDLLKCCSLMYVFSYYTEPPPPRFYSIDTLHLLIYAVYLWSNMIVLALKTWLFNAHSHCFSTWSETLQLLLSCGHLGSQRLWHLA